MAMSMMQPNKRMKLTSARLKRKVNKVVHKAD